VILNSMMIGRLSILGPPVYMTFSGSLSLCRSSHGCGRLAEFLFDTPEYEQTGAFE
jgi:hypothetical protein